MLEKCPLWKHAVLTSEPPSEFFRYSSLAAVWGSDEKECQCALYIAQHYVKQSTENNMVKPGAV